jgi:hypothetical protein
VLQEAVRLGGSTIRDHRTAEGGWGSFQKRHGVYGRAGLPCGNCGRLLCSRTVAQRTTVFCPDCQTRTPKEPGGSPLARGGSPGASGPATGVEIEPGQTPGALRGVDRDRSSGIDHPMDRERPVGSGQAPQ